MASLFWVGGTANYDGTTNHFATTTGGTATVAAVTSADTVTFDSNSGTGTVTMTANWSSGSVTFNQTGLTLTTNGTVTFTIATASSLTLTNGTINTNGSTCSWGSFTLGAGTKTLTFGATTLTLTGASGVLWSTNTNSAGFTLSAASSAILASGQTAAYTFAGGGKTYNNVTLPGNQGVTISNSDTYANLTIIGTAGNKPSLTLSGDITITTLLTLTGTNSGTVAGRVQVVPGSVPNFGNTQRTITAAAASFTKVDFGGMIAAGAAAPFTGSQIGDLGNNSGITVDVSRTLYWIATAGGNWNALASWSLSTGGASASTEPLPQDDVIFDANSITSSGRTINGNATRYWCRNADFSAVANNPQLSIGTFNPGMLGSLTLGTITTNSTTAATLTIMPTSSAITLKCNGSIISFNLQFSPLLSTASLALQDNLSQNNAANNLTITSGIFTTNNFSITTGLFASNNSNTRTLNLGSSVITLNGTGLFFNTATQTGLTLNGSSATINVTDTSATAKSIEMRNQTIGTLNITGGNSATFTFGAGASLTATYTNLILGVNTTYILSTQPSSKIAVTNLTATGSAGNLITIISSTPGTQATISKTSGIVSCDYLSLTDSNATGGAAWYAGVNSTNVSNNSGWIFTAPGSGTPNFLTMGIG